MTSRALLTGMAEGASRCDTMLAEAGKVQL